MFYAAQDVSLRRWRSASIGHGGRIYFWRSVRSDARDLLRCFVAFGQPIHQVGSGPAR